MNEIFTDTNKVLNKILSSDHTIKLNNFEYIF